MHQGISVNTEKAYISALVQHCGFSYTEQGTAVILRVPSDLGTGYMKIDRVSEDMSIGTMDLLLKDPLVTFYDSYANTPIAFPDMLRILKRISQKLGLEAMKSEYMRCPAAAG